MNNLITRKEYMNDSKNLHHDYFLQFVTESTKRFINSVFTIEQLLGSNDPHLNDLAKHEIGGGWIWNRTPFNQALMRELGEVNINTASNSTCVGKAYAKQLIIEARNAK